MALDIYVGSLTRYYLQDWETGGARVAREMGASYETVRPGPQPTDDAPQAPYFTDRPAWEGYAGVLLLAAHTECPELPRPEVPTSQWDGDAAYQKVAAQGFPSRFPQIYDVQLWLPCRFSFKFKSQDVSGAEVWIGSSLRLLDELTLLDAETFRVGFGAAFENSEVANTFDKSARFGLEMFLRCARFAAEHRLPMKLDY